MSLERVADEFGTAAVEVEMDETISEATGLGYAGDAWIMLGQMVPGLFYRWEPRLNDAVACEGVAEAVYEGAGRGRVFDGSLRRWR